MFFLSRLRGRVSSWKYLLPSSYNWPFESAALQDSNSLDNFAHGDPEKGGSALPTAAGSAVSQPSNVGQGTSF
jgi:hypothetical protein